MSLTSKRRVVITGLGCVSPVGNNIADTWAAILAGKSGIAATTVFLASPDAGYITGTTLHVNGGMYLC